MPHLDIVIYALIAVVLLARLWSVFGRRNEDDPQRPNPFATPAPGKRDEDEEQAQLRGESDNTSRPIFAPILMAPNSLAGTLDRVKQMDPAFDEKEFLRKMRSVFTSILEAFAKGDLAPVKGKLGPAVTASFDAAIAARRKAGETLENRVMRVKDVETASAKFDDDSKVSITVRFVSEQQNVIRDASGNVVSGTPDQTEEITDLWTFSRDLQSSSSDWRLIETKS